MTRYKNLSGSSGVRAYEIGKNSITIEFIDGSTYIYTSKSTSAANISQMKKLAVAGKGLSTFISTTVRKGYASKIR